MEPRPFCSSPHPLSEWAVSSWETEKGHSQDSWPQLTKAYPILCGIMISKKSQGKMKEGRTV